MRDQHVPDDDFVERLEWRIGAEARRRNRLASAAPRWLPASPVWRVAVIGGVIAASMGLGGAAVAASYQAQANERRNVLLPSYQRGVEVAREQVDEAVKVLKGLQQQVSIGIAADEDVADARAKVVAAQADLQAAQLSLDEVRATGQPPISDVAAPLVSGRDFVSERWRAEMAGPEASLQSAEAHLREAQRRVSLGMASQIEIDRARARIVELEAGILGFRRKLDVRRQFLNRDRDAAAASLLVQQIDAEQKRSAIASQIDLAQKNLAAIQTKAAAGVAQQLDVARARLDVQQLEVEMAKANVDLEVVRRQLAERGIK